MVCKLQLFVVLLIVVVCRGRKFQNPVSVDNYSPNVISFNNSYYMVATKGEEDIQPGLFPIYQSTDLEKWNLISFAIDYDSVPSWASRSSLRSPHLHFRDGYFYLFFGGKLDFGDDQKIGVAKSKSIAGPYVSESTIIDPQGTGVMEHPAILVDNTNGDTYLVWTQWDSKIVLGQQINLTDFTLLGSGPKTLIRPTLEWENFESSPNVAYRNGFYYILYSTNFDCTSSAAGIGVARSKSPLGPYKKSQQPLLLTYTSVGYSSLVKDVDGSSDVLLFLQGCYPPEVIANTVVWTSDNWPHFE